MDKLAIVVLALLLIGATYKWRLHPLIVSLLGGVVFSALFAVADWLGPRARANPLLDFLGYVFGYGLVIAIVCLLAARPFGEWWVKKEASEEESASTEPEEPRRF